MNGISHKGLQSAVFAGGCFWCVEADYGKRPDIKDVESGYTGGDTDDPQYETAHKHGHREAVRVWFDPKNTEYEDLVIYFFTIHNPADAGGSFHDRGHQYTSAIYYENDEQKEIARNIKKRLDESDVFDTPITTEIIPLQKFWTAEEYHQNYAEKSAAHYKLYRNASGRDEYISDKKEAIHNALK